MDTRGSWKDRFEDAVKDYFDIPGDADITIEEQCHYYEGCPTCGGDYEWTVTAYWKDDKNKWRVRTYKGSLIDFIQNLD